MRLAICTRYWHHEATYLAIRLAEWYDQQGGDVSLLSLWPAPHPIGSRFDRHVQAPPYQFFSPWMLTGPRPDVCVWTHVPAVQQLNYVRELGIKTVIIPLIGELDSNDRAAMSLADVVLCPLKSTAATLFRNWGLSSLVSVPWDTGDPPIQKCEHADESPRVLFPLYDGVARRMEGTALVVLERMLRRFPDVRLTTLYSSSTLAPYALRRLRQLHKQFGDRAIAVPGLSMPHRPLLFQAHDLTFWPTHGESTCLLGLTSVTSGTPVLTFALPTIQEHFGPHNAVLADMVVAAGPGGRFSAEPDYVHMDQLLTQLLTSRAALASLQQSVLQGVSQRRSGFEAAMAAVFLQPS